MSEFLVHSITAMGTVVTIQVVGHGEDELRRQERSVAVERAIGWFQQIHDSCTRFDPRSELSLLTAQVGKPVEVSPLLYQAVRFAMAVAEESNGAFDPTVGHRMEQRGFNREFRSGLTVRTEIPPDRAASYRDVHVDPHRPAITLFRPLVLDLGAVAKGLAIDMAVHELESFSNFSIDARGDLYLGGHNAEGSPWPVGIRHPHDEEQLLATILVSDGAVCTSGVYGRHVPTAGEERHIMDARSGSSAAALASVTVLAPSAMVADALATAVFVLGPESGLELLEQHGVEGLMVTPTLERFTTPGMRLE